MRKYEEKRKIRLLKYTVIVVEKISCKRWHDYGRGSACDGFLGIFFRKRRGTPYF